jgi:hypothetical protein
MAKYNFDDWGKGAYLVTGATGLGATGTASNSQWADLGGCREGVLVISKRVMPTGIVYNVHTTYSTGTTGVAAANDVLSSDAVASTGAGADFVELNDLQRYVRMEYKGGTGCSGGASFSASVIGWNGHDRPVN